MIMKQNVNNDVIEHWPIAVGHICGLCFSEMYMYTPISKNVRENAKLSVDKYEIA